MRCKRNAHAHDHALAHTPPSAEIAAFLTSLVRDLIGTDCRVSMHSPITVKQTSTRDLAESGSLAYLFIQQ